MNADEVGQAYPLISFTFFSPEPNLKLESADAFTDMMSVSCAHHSLCQAKTKFEDCLYFGQADIPKYCNCLYTAVPATVRDMATRSRIAYADHAI